MSRSVIQCKGCGETLALRHHGGRIDLLLGAITAAALVAAGAEVTCRCMEPRFLRIDRDQTIGTATVQYGEATHPQRPVKLNDQVVATSEATTPEGFGCRLPAKPPEAESGSGVDPDTTP